MLLTAARFQSESQHFTEALQAFQELLRFWQVNWSKDLGYALILQEIAGMAWSQGNLDHAEQYAEAAFKIQIRLASESHELAATYNLLGLAALQRGNLDLADEYYLRSLAIEETLGDEHEVGNSLNNLGTVTYARGNLSQAMLFFQLAYEIRQRFAPDSLEIAESLNNLGITTEQLGDLDLAETYYQCSLELSERLLPDSTNVAETLGNLGVLYYIRSDLEAAEARFRRKLKLEEQLAPDSLYLAKTISNLGVIAIEKGDLASADSFLSRALDITEKIAPGSLNSAAILGNLGIVEYHRGNLEQAATYLRRTLGIQKKYVRESPDLAITLNNLANLEIALGNLSAAEKYHKLALEIREAISPDSLDVAVSLQNLGTTAYYRSDLGSAEESNKKALVIQERLAPESLAVVNSLNNLADVAAGRGDKKSARAYLERALGILDHIPHRKIDEAVTLHAMADLLREDDLQLAKSYLQKAVDALEIQAGKLGGSQEVKATFRAKYDSYYRELIDLLVEEKDNTKAFDLLERSRAKSLLSMLYERDLAFLRDIPPELERERRQLASRYDRLQQELSATGGQMDASREEDLRIRLYDILKEQEEVAARIRQASSRLAALQYPQPLDLRGVQVTLDPGTVMLAYSVSQNATRVFVVRNDHPMEVITLAVGQKDLAEEVRELRLLITSSLSHDHSQEVRAASQRLYRKLIEPVEGFAEQSRRLLLVPDGPLHTLPWAALARSESSTGKRWQYLVEWKPIHVAISGTVYAELKSWRGKSRNTRAPRLVAFGDPLYPRNLENASGNAHLRSSTERGYVLEPLPASRIEVNRVASLFAEGAKKHLGPDATEERAKTVDRSSLYVHFAAHGIMDDRFPLNSAIALTIPETFNEGRDNGLLQVWEIFESVRVDADLVVLSACDSGLGKELGGEGLSGLTRAFHYAGARSVLASLWEVSDDESTAKLMVLFYRNLKHGKSKDEALRAAQIELIRSRDRDASSPFAWAAFQLFGDWW